MTVSEFRLGTPCSMSAFVRDGSIELLPAIEQVVGIDGSNFYVLCFSNIWQPSQESQRVMRAAVTGYAKKLAGEIDYNGFLTVDFIVDETNPRDVKVTMNDPNSGPGGSINFMASIAGLPLQMIHALAAQGRIDALPKYLGYRIEDALAGQLCASLTLPLLDPSQVSGWRGDGSPIGSLWTRRHGGQLEVQAASKEPSRTPVGAAILDAVQESEVDIAAELLVCLHVSDGEATRQALESAGRGADGGALTG